MPRRQMPAPGHGRPGTGPPSFAWAGVRETAGKTPGAGVTTWLVWIAARWLWERMPNWAVIEAVTVACVFFSLRK